MSPTPAFTPYPAAAHVPATAAGRVPHYGHTAEVTGSLIFLVLLAALVGAAFFKRRR